ncbi:hypothetical protein LPJ72_005371 [Coemansia sp. Benny D160-2]|nr:hypothetical protein LPJ72_005371 [Coemansia sp. Benny D160-2]
MILLSVLMVVIGLAVVITFYYFRTALSWVLDVKTTDQDLVNPNSRNGVRRSGLSFLQTDNVHYQQQHQQQQHQQQKHPQHQQQPHARCMDAGHGPNNDGARILPRNLLYGVQHDPALMQRPWMSVQGRNSRAWRQMRARQRSSSLSSSATSPTDSDSCGQQQSPRRPPRAARKHQAHARSSQLPGRKSAPQQSSQSE